MHDELCLLWEIIYEGGWMLWQAACEAVAAAVAGSL